MSMKMISNVVIAAGVALCAAYGARLPDQTFEYHVKKAKKELGELKPQAPSERLTEWGAASGLPFALGCVLIAGGAFVARREEALEHSDEGSTKGGKGKEEPIDLGALLHNIQRELEALKEACSQAHEAEQLKSLRERIQKLQRGDLERVIEAGAKVKARYGLAYFAELYGAIAQGERRLNRAWSALVDAHVPEAQASLEGASASLTEACALIERKS